DPALAGRGILRRVVAEDDEVVRVLAASHRPQQDVEPLVFEDLPGVEEGQRGVAVKMVYGRQLMILDADQAPRNDCVRRYSPDTRQTYAADVVGAVEEAVDNRQRLARPARSLRHGCEDSSDEAER